VDTVLPLMNDTTRFEITEAAALGSLTQLVRLIAEIRRRDAGSGSTTSATA